MFRSYGETVRRFYAVPDTEQHFPRFRSPSRRRPISFRVPILGACGTHVRDREARQFFGAHNGAETFEIFFRERGWHFFETAQGRETLSAVPIRNAAPTVRLSDVEISSGRAGAAKGVADFAPLCGLRRTNGSNRSKGSRV